MCVCKCGSGGFIHLQDQPRDYTAVDTKEEVGEWMSPRTGIYKCVCGTRYCYYDVLSLCVYM